MKAPRFKPGDKVTVLAPRIFAEREGGNMSQREVNEVSQRFVADKAGSGPVVVLVVETRRGAHFIGIAEYKDMCCEERFELYDGPPKPRQRQLKLRARGVK